MGEVVVKVNGREFQFSCADGEEPRIRRLAQYVDAKVGDFVKSVGQVGEARLILFAAITIADELSDTNEACRGAHPGPRRRRGGRRIRRAAAGIRGLARRVESIAARIETS